MRLAHGHLCGEDTEAEEATVAHAAEHIHLDFKGGFAVDEPRLLLAEHLDERFSACVGQFLHLQPRLIVDDANAELQRHIRHETTCLVAKRHVHIRLACFDEECLVRAIHVGVKPSLEAELGEVTVAASAGDEGLGTACGCYCARIARTLLGALIRRRLGLGIIELDEHIRDVLVGHAKELAQGGHIHLAQSRAPQIWQRMRAVRLPGRGRRARGRQAMGVEMEGVRRPTLEKSRRARARGHGGCGRFEL
mmetsp:Transcript_4973/g.14671  ORF Transcript_4973/g.14671 Transcript_4973/m.14671 type:complete len:250 (-) Transcript_4973:135-884(-)